MYFDLAESSATTETNPRQEKTAMNISSCTKTLGLAVLTGTLVLTAGDVASGQAGVKPGKACNKSALAARTAANREAWAVFWNEISLCLNETPFTEVVKRAKKAEKALKDAQELVEDQFDERIQVCQQLGQSPYDPNIDPLEFTSVVDNPYFPLIIGNTNAYEGDTLDGIVRIEDTTLNETRQILGVDCAVVECIEYLDDVVTRQTRRYYAQHTDGTVWYFGQQTFAIEDDVIVDMDGSWIAESKGAKPGIVMLAAADIGLVYRQSFLPNVAEDVAKFQATGVSVTVPYNSQTYLDCWQIRNTTPLDPDALEQRFFAQGVGLVKTVDADTGDVFELVEILP